MLREIVKDLRLVLPLNPRIKQKNRTATQCQLAQRHRRLEPLPYLEMQCLQMSARHTLTDYGDIQKKPICTKYLASPCAWHNTFRTVNDPKTFTAMAVQQKTYKNSSGMTLVNRLITGGGIVGASIMLDQKKRFLQAKIRPTLEKNRNLV